MKNDVNKFQININQELEDLSNVDNNSFFNFLENYNPKIN